MLNVLQELLVIKNINTLIRHITMLQSGLNTILCGNTRLMKWHVDVD